MSKHVLSKSSFIRGVQCHKSLYLYKKRYFLRDPLPPEQLARFRRGTEVGKLARELFPGGMDCSPATPFQFAKSVGKTKTLIDTKTPVLYEAAFIYHNTLAALDILVYDPDSDTWDGYEVKSSLIITDTYLMDAALQWYVISGAGIRIRSISIIYMNRDYVREGDLDLNQLFIKQDVTGESKKRQKYVFQEIQTQLGVAALKKSPQIAVGPHCHKPYTCDFMGHCHTHLLTSSVLRWAWLSFEQRYELLRNKLQKEEDFTPSFFIDRRLNDKLNAHIRKIIHISRSAKLISNEAAGQHVMFLKAYYYRPAVPAFDGHKPYEPIPYCLSALITDINDHRESFSHYYFGFNFNSKNKFTEALAALIRPKTVVLVYSDDALSNEVRISSAAGANYQVIDLYGYIEQGHYYNPASNGEPDLLKWKEAFVEGMDQLKAAHSNDTFVDLEIRDLVGKSATGAESDSIQQSARLYLKRMQHIYLQIINCC